jgi:hypothetical protein
MRRSSLSLLTLLFLTLLAACGSPGRSCQERLQAEEIVLCLPRDWEPVPEEVLREKGVPEETLGAVRLRTSKEGEGGGNVVISREGLESELSSLLYAQGNMRTVEVLPEYERLELQEVAIDGEETLLHIFAARPIADLPLRRFYQLSLTKELVGYTVTGTLPYAPKEKQEEEMIEIMTRVKLQEERETASEEDEPLR